MRRSNLVLRTCGIAALRITTIPRDSERSLASGWNATGELVLTFQILQIEHNTSIGLLLRLRLPLKVWKDDVTCLDIAWVGKNENVLWRANLENECDCSNLRV